ncbi:MAG: AAA family ATPase [Gemmatimonadota bacterium]
MRLISLRLHNFRQHADTEIEFRTGLTGVIGPNGAGKSTLLEAIAWALYGSAAARGTNETIRFARAPGGSQVRVELVFGLGGHEFRVVRSMSNAEVFLDGGESPVASSIGGATEYLERRLGMSRDEFFNTYFTGQNELQFLARMGSAQRGRFLSQVLGYERLRVAQESARVRRNELRHERDGLRAGLPDPGELEAELRAAERRRAEALDAVEAAESAFEAAERIRDGLRPRWEAAQEARERARELAHAREVADREREAAERDRARAAAELEKIAGAAEELESLRARLKPLPGLVEENERLAELARLNERRGGLAQAEGALVEELEKGAERLERLERAPVLLERYRGDLEARRTELAAAEDEVSALRSDWDRRRQETETKLATYRERAQELQRQTKVLREAGPEGECPTCERPLGAEFDKVVGRLDDEWERLVQDGKWLRQRLDQLEAKPRALVEAEARRDALRNAVDEVGRKAAKCESGVRELEELRREREGKRVRLEKLRAELDAIPGGYDRKRHEEASAELERLRELERRADRLEQVVEVRAAREAERDEAASRRAAAEERRAAAVRELEALDFREAAFRELREEVEAGEAAAREAELRSTELRGLVQAASETLESVTRAQAVYREKRERLDAIEVDVRHHDELDAALTELRGELNARVRPELAELASTFLAEITEGRYTSLEIDESYDILVLDEGEEKPVISGGEEDIANLVLRLAVSQMIAERAGHPLTTLILDEVFGSLDLERRDNVVELLHRIGDRFEQVILITHIESIREGLDTVLRVEFDERTGSSVVTEESFAGGVAGEEAA